LPHDEREQLQRRGVGQVKVIEAEHDRAPFGGAAQKQPDAIEHAKTCRVHREWIGVVMIRKQLLRIVHGARRVRAPWAISSRICSGPRCCIASRKACTNGQNAGTPSPSVQRPSELVAVPAQRANARMLRAALTEREACAQHCTLERTGLDFGVRPQRAQQLVARDCAVSVRDQVQQQAQHFWLHLDLLVRPSQLETITSSSNSPNV
jgi:hypothetical protein